MKHLVSLVFVLFTMPALAAQVTIDFEALPDTGFLNPGAFPVVTEGFSFAAPSTSQGITSWPVGSADGQVFHWCGAGALCGSTDAMVMTASQPGGFDLISLDLASSLLSQGTGQATENLLLTGAFIGGGTIQTTVAITSQNFSTFNLGGGWSNLASLTLDPQDGLSVAVGLDNVVVNVVPIPAAAYLFVSALLGLGWFRRIRPVSTR